MVEHETVCARHRRELSASIYTLLFLLIAAPALERGFYSHLEKLARGGQISRWSHLMNYFHIGMTIVFLAELSVVMCLYRLGPLRTTLRGTGLSVVNQKWVGLASGFLAGLLVYVASLPLLRLDRGSDLTDLIIRDIFHPRIVLVVILFAILLPAGSEIVFRGIIFKSFLESSSLVPAVLLSAFAFGLVWPVFNFVTGLLLGLTNALLYHRFRSVIPTVLANAVLTVAYAATLVWRRVY